eukprot:3333234-Rhodomonas_salina.1
MPAASPSNPGQTHPTAQTAATSSLSPLTSLTGPPGSLSGAECVCPAGFAGSSGQCVACAFGTYKPMMGALSPRAFKAHVAAQRDAGTNPDLQVQVGCRSTQGAGD